MKDFLRRAHVWFSQKADTVYARAWLFILSFTESCIFFIPPDPLLAAMVFVKREKWLDYALLTLVASLLGAVVGYALGAVLFETIGVRVIALYHLQEYMAQATELIQNGVFIFTLTTAFTPIPFKAAVLAAGFTKSNFILFLVAAFLGRIARYVGIAYLAKVFGAYSENIIEKFWWYTSIGGGVLIVLYALYVILT